jgi:hypothetical protein
VIKTVTFLTAWRARDSTVTSVYIQIIVGHYKEINTDKKRLQYNEKNCFEYQSTAEQIIEKLNILLEDSVITKPV